MGARGIKLYWNVAIPSALQAIIIISSTVIILIILIRFISVNIAIIVASMAGTLIGMMIDK
jgi:hypothetical protein